MVPHNPNELVAIIDENDNIIGNDTRDNAHEKGLLHREIAVMILNKNNEILMQVRKDDGRYGFSAGGHFPFSESYLQGAIRETKEELGLELDEADLKKISKLRLDFSRGELRNNVFLEIFEVRKDFKINDFKIDRSEVESVRFFSRNQIEKIISENPEGFSRSFKRVFELYYKQPE